LKPDWVNSYYEALEFFYWEPQHLRVKAEIAAEVATLERVARQSKKVDRVRTHLRNMEVTLNHNVRQFFLLAPDALRNRLFSELFNRSFPEAFILHGDEADEEFTLSNCTQPDLLFVSKGQVVCIEMKIEAKCTVDQIRKYALLGLAVELAVKHQKEHFIAVLGPGSFNAIFKERFESLEAELAATACSSFQSKMPLRFRGHEERLREILGQMQLQFFGYKRFARFLENERPPQNVDSPGTEVYNKLIAGLVEEFRKRNLLNTGD
jgi:hypothetical protein